LADPDIPLAELGKTAPRVDSFQQRALSTWASEGGSW
jgi:hypothetical protein